MKKLFFLLFVSVGLFNLVQAQNGIVGDMASGWPGSCNANTGVFYMTTSAGTSYTSGDRTPTGTGNKYWRLLIDYGGTVRQENNGGTSDVAVTPGTKYTLNTTCASTGAMYYNVSSVSNRYIFKTKDASASPIGDWVFFELGGASVTVNWVSQSPSTPTVNDAVTITATMSGALPTGQGVYLRYSTDNFSTSTIASMSGSGTTYSASISAKSLSTIVKYYVFTSGSGLTIATTDADLYTINWNAGGINGGSNYLYTVAAAPATTYIGKYLFDFGPTAGTNGDNTTGADANGNFWNNITAPDAGGAGIPITTTTFSGLKNSANSSSLYVLTVTGGGFVSNGKANGGLRSPYASQFMAAGSDPDLAIGTATEDFWYTPSTSTPAFKISGLNANKKYRFKIFGTRNGAVLRTAQYTIVGAATTVGTLNNSTLAGMGGTVYTGTGWAPDGDNSYKLNSQTGYTTANTYYGNNSSTYDTGIISPNGSGEFTLTLASNVSGQNAFINSMKLEEYKGTQTITFNALPAKAVGDADFSAGASSTTSGINPIKYSSSNTSVATISASGVISLVGINGTSDITAYQDATSDYDGASVMRTLTVTALPFISSFTTANNNGTTTSGYIGTTVTVTGSNLNNVTTLKVGGSGGTTISSFTKNSTTITFTATAGLSGTIYVSNGTDTYTSGSSHVDLGYVTNAATDWNTASTWLGGAVPPVSSAVSIAHNITLNAAATNNITSLTIKTSSGITFGSSGSITVSGTTTNSGSIIMTAGGTLTVGAAGTLANGTSTFTAGAGTVIFAGAGTLSGTISLNNLTLNGVLTNPTTVTVNGTLQLNSGSTVSNAPTYGSSSTLMYNTGGTIAMGTEWTANATTGSGVPQNITIGNGVNTIVDFSASANWYLLSGDFLINSGSTLKLPATNTSNGLKFGGNLTNNGTLNTNGGAIWFVGTAIKTLASSSNQIIDYLKLVGTADLKLSGSNFTINAAQLGLQFQSTGGLDLNGKTLTMKSGATIVLRTSSGVTVKTISSSTAGGILAMEGGCLLSTETTGGSLATTSAVTVTLAGALTIGTANTLSIAGILKINSGGSVITNSPIFATGATLNYDLNNGSGAKYNQALEWPATSGPTSVLLTTNSWVQLNSDRSLTGNLTITSGALQATGGVVRTLTMSGTTQTITVSSTTGGAIYGTENGPGNDLQLTIANGSTTTFSGDATTTDDDEKKLFNVNVNSGAVLALSRGILCKWGAFTVNGILKINANGYVQSNNTTNSAPTSSNKSADYSGGGSLVYNTGGTYLSSDKEWPTSNSPVNVTIQNAGTDLSLNSSKNIGGVLTLANGTLTTDANTLTITGSIAATGGLINTGTSGTLVFAGTSEQTLPASCLTSGSVNVLTINAGAKLSTSGTISAGSLNILSDGIKGTGTLKDGGLLSSANSNIQQYLSAARNWYISSPVSGAKAKSGFTFYRRDEANNNWVTMTTGDGSASGDALNVGQGYIANFASGTATYTFTGSLNTGNPDITIYRTTAQAIKPGFNLIGNPYPSYLNMRSIVNSTSNLEKSIWYRTQKNSTSTYYFDTYNTVGNLGTNNSQNNPFVIGTVAPMQAVWVRVSAGQSSSTITFNNSYRSHANDTINPLKSKALNAAEQPILRLQVSNGTNSDEAIVYFNSNASNAYDNYDSPKMSNNSTSVPEIYLTAGGEQLSIDGLNSVPYDTELVLGFTNTASQTGSFSLKASQFSSFDPGTELYLKDYQSADPTQLINLSDGKSYTFNSDAVNTTGRFALIFKAPSLTTGINPDTHADVWISMNANNQIVLNGLIGATKVAVYNELGQKILSQTLTTGTKTLETKFATGIYFVTINNTGKTITKKVIID